MRNTVPKHVSCSALHHQGGANKRLWQFGIPRGHGFEHPISNLAAGQRDIGIFKQSQGQVKQNLTEHEHSHSRKGRLPSAGRAATVKVLSLCLVSD